MVRPEGFEPPAFCSVDRRSIQLSYGRFGLAAGYNSSVFPSGHQIGAGVRVPTPQNPRNHADDSVLRRSVTNVN